MSRIIPVSKQAVPLFWTMLNMVHSTEQEVEVDYTFDDSGCVYVSEIRDVRSKEPVTVSDNDMKRIKDGCYTDERE